VFFCNFTIRPPEQILCWAYSIMQASGLGALKH
jgi:hypothetical protein